MERKESVIVSDYNIDFQNSISAYYGKLHNELKNRYSSGQRKDQKQAMELERFFNYLVYQNNASELALNSLLTQELAEYILQKNPNIGFLLRKTSKQSNIQGIRGEKGFAALISKTIQAVSEEPTTLPRFSTLVTGDQLVTVLKDLPENIGKNITKQVSASLNEVGQMEENSSQLYGKFQQKTDIQSMRVLGEYSLKPGYEWLLDLSATVKNYTGNTISVGNTSHMKIMRATIVNSKTLSKQQKTLLLSQLNQMDKLNIYNRGQQFRNTDNFKHFQHIQAIYDLIGFGQGKLNENNIFQGAELPRYLMVNIQSAQRIVIRSTRQLVSDILKNQNVSITASGTRFTF